MQHGRRLAVGDVGYQRGQVIVTRSMGCCIDADSKSIAAETFSGVAARTMRQCGHQVREFKSHFRSPYVVLALSTNFGTNRLALGLSPALRLSLHSESVRRREGSRSGLRTPLCADKRYGAE